MGKAMKKKKKKQRCTHHSKNTLPLAPASFLSKPQRHLQARPPIVHEELALSESAGPSIGRKLLFSGVTDALAKELRKYWLRRYDLFSRFDDGIKLDREGLFSVTPEDIAVHQASRCGSNKVVIDAFAGVGGNAIQFALSGNYVVAIDIDSTRIECAQHNANVYGVADKIDFIVGNFFQIAPSLKADVIFLSPPWGGPDYLRSKIYNIETMMRPINGFTIFHIALTVAPSLVLFLPRTVDMEQLAQLAWLSNPPLPYNVEKNFVDGQLKGLTVYYGNVAC